ncbi:MAG: hypothetical protein IKA59_03780 [Clostridia bacterium]|nr:hypothetical protein [Clostridia bacterium]
MRRRNEIHEEIMEMLEDIGASKYEQCEDWRGYGVYEPVFDEPCYLGMPMIILEDREYDVCFWADGDTAMEYLMETAVLEE